MGIDWSQIGPSSNEPGPSTATVPVAPPSGITGLPTAPSAGGITGIPGGAAPVTPYQTGHGYHDATQEQVDQLSLGDKIGRGIDFLGNALFGSDEHSLLKQKVGPVQFVGDVFGAAGNVVHAGGDYTVVKPIESVAQSLSNIPLSAVPGGADDTFATIGDKLKIAADTDPFYAQAYQQWQIIKAASDAKWGGQGGNMKADFNAEFLKAQDDRLHDSVLGSSPDFAIGKGEVGSVGGALSLTIRSFLGLGGNAVQGAAGSLGLFNPSAGGPTSYAAALAAHNKPDTLGDVKPSELGELAVKQVQAGALTPEQADQLLSKFNSGPLNRVEESAARLALGGEVSDVEKNAVESWQSGAWSMKHAEDWIISHGQSITRNPLGQALGSVVTDPLTYATIGAGAISAAGEGGLQLAEAGGATLEKAAQGASIGERLAVRGANAAAIGAVEGETPLQKMALTVARLQQGQMGPAFRLARGMIDPLGVYKPSTVQRATTDLYNGAAISAFERAYDPAAVAEVHAVAREVGVEPEINSAIASYSLDKANEMMLAKTQQRLLDEGMGEEMLTSAVGHPDDFKFLARQAGRDAETEVTDYMQRIAKNTWTAEEKADLPYRVAATLGKDPSFWAERLPKMSENARNVLHALTYKRAEVGFEQAKTAAKATYTGSLPLDKAVLMDANTLDNLNAKSISEYITNLLKSDDPVSIQTATNEWNRLARKYTGMESVGYAPGGKAQLEDLVKKLDAKNEAGGFTKRAEPDELKDLQPIRDFLDRNTIPTATSGVTRFPAVTGMSPQPLINEFGYPLARAQELVDKAEMVPTKLLEPLREVDRRAKPELTIHGDLETLQSSIEANGGKMTAPIIIWHDPESGATVVADGNHRLTVALEQGYDSVPAVVEIRPANEIAEAENVDKIAHVTPKEGAPTSGIIKPSDFFPEQAGAGERRIWNVGFRPDEEVAWGVKRDPNNGQVIYDRVPTISHVIDAVPGRQHFSDMTRNVLGQIIGPSKAERLNAPVDSMEAFVNTLRDGITGQRLVNNMARRFEKSTFDAGIPKALSNSIWEKARDVAGFNSTTIRGIKPDNLWQSIADDIPRDFRMADGSTLNVHVVMDHLLRASEGDLRIMGLTSNLSQRMRTALHAHGDSANWGGQMTVTMYNKLRYSQPMFLMQRMTDSVYYSILYGVTPVGKGALTGELGDLEKIMENIGRTGFARDFSMDMPEYATRSNFTAGIKSAMQEAGLKDSQLQRIGDAPNIFIANNMTNMLHSRLGDIVQGVVDNIGKTAETADPALQVEMLRAGEELKNSFADWRRTYSQNAGRVLNNNEVGMQYVKDMLNAWRRHVVNEDGTLDFSRLVAEGERSLPDSIGEVGPIKPAILAQEFGYKDVAAMRADYTQSVKKVNGEFVVTKGNKDLARLEQDLKSQLNAHPDYVRRATAYFGDNWDDFFYRMSRPVEKGGLDISPHYAKEAQDLIAMQARERGMDPWEYLSGVMTTNLGVKDADTALGQFVGFLKASKADQPIEAWSEQFRAHLDVSAQETLLQHFESENNLVSGLSKKGMKQVMSKKFPEAIRERMTTGVPHPNPEVEGYMQAFAKWVKQSIPSSELAERTRSDLRTLVENIPTTQAVNYNRTHALIVSLLKDKIEDAQQDVFRLAEMQTKRTVIERSLNHPLFGLYPASYMWGKVLPETVKFLAKNPYAATYAIADVQRAIAIQREYDPDFDHKMNAIDRSSGAFLLDYLTPGLPWSDHSARMSPLVRDIIKGNFGKIWPDELATVTPDRWISQISKSVGEIPGAVNSISAPPPTPSGIKGLEPLAGSSTPAQGQSQAGEITGPTPAAALAPILRDDLTRLQDIFVSGNKPG